MYAPSSLVAKVLERFYADYPSLQQILDQLSIYEIICPLKVIINYEKATLYPSFLRYLKNIRISRLKSPLSEKIQLYVLQIQLRILQKDFKGAAACWLSLYYLEEGCHRKHQVN